jgi:serine/threonine protein kinase
VNEPFQPEHTAAHAQSARSQDEQDSLVGVLVADRYRVIERIGEGGMGVVYRAEHVTMRKQVAIKFLHTDAHRSMEVVQRFEREALSASRLGHPNILHVMDFGRIEDHLMYLVMELIEGESLAAVLERERALPVDRAVTIAKQVLDALEHAHSRGVVHRDLKPENIMLVRVEGVDGDFVKLLDFGIAKLQDDDPNHLDPKITRAGLVFGTPDYMSPEQALGQEVDHRVDVYSSGVVLFEMLTGRRPFESEVFLEVLTMKLHQDAPRLRAAAPESHWPGELERIIERALQREPARRYPSAAAFSEALREFTIPPPRTSGARLHTSEATEHLRQWAIAHSPRIRHAWSEVVMEPLARLSQPLRVRLKSLIPAPMRTRAAAISAPWLTRFRALSPNVRRGFLGGTVAGVTLVMVTLWMGSSEPHAATGGNPLDPQAKQTRAESDRTSEVARNAIAQAEKALQDGSLPTARTWLVQAEKADPSNAKVFFLWGNLRFLEQNPELGIAAYSKAMQLDPSFRSDPILLRDTMPLVNHRRYGVAALDMLIEIGKPACPTLAQVASGEKRATMRSAARAATERLDCHGVDLVESYLLDLKDARTCDERGAAVQALGKLRDRRALKTLQAMRARKAGLFSSAKAHACIMPQLDEAVAAIQRGAPPTPARSTRN